MVHEVSVGYEGALEEGLVQSSCNIFSQASIDLTTLLLLVLLHSSLADDKILSAGLLSWLLSEKRYWRLRRLESAVPAQLALKNVTLRKGRDTLCKVRQSGTCCAEREQPICTASRWQLMESLSGTAVSSTVAIVGSIWPKGPAQAGPAIQAQWFIF